METIEEIKTEELILNAEPEFCEGFTGEVLAQYFILCENNANQEFGGSVYDAKILGVPILDWVKRACSNKAIVLNINDEDEIIPLLRPYLNGAEYSVVLYANTPLATKQHIIDLLGFVGRKRMNVCKLKKGFVFRNEFIEKADEFFSIDTYNFASNDLFEVKTLVDLEFAKNELKKRLICYFANNGVLFENPDFMVIDATAQIEYASKISSGVRVIGNSKLGTNSSIKANAIIKNSKIGDDVEIGENSIIEGTIIKSGTKVEEGTIIKGSVVGENCEIKTGSKIIRSGLKESVKIGECSTIIDSKLGCETSVGECVNAVGCSFDDGANVLAGENLVSKLIENVNINNQELEEEE